MSLHVISTVIAAGGLDPESLLKSFGALGLFLIIFAESGLFFGFFLPGDSLLFTAGLLSSQDKMPALPILLVGCFIAAVAGDQVGYVFGRKVGPALFSRPDSRVFKQEYVEKAQGFFDRHGSKTIVMARFVPVVRTFAPMVAGIAGMNYRRFVMFNIVGGILWIVSMTLVGYFFGQIPFVQKHLEKIILGALLAHVLIIPVVATLLKKIRLRKAG